MSVSSIAFSLLAWCILGSFATNGNDEVPQPPPGYCNDPFFRGTGRATHNRFWYNSATRECEMVVWTGGVAKENNFDDVEQCEEICKRTGVRPRKLVTCSFAANLGRDCHINPAVDLRYIRLCQDSQERLSEEGCLSRGCCYESGFCYEKTNEFTKAECVIRSSTESGFWGKINFQSDIAYPEDWVGTIRFNLPIGGDFCILDDFTNDVGLSTSIANRTRFLLPGRSELHPGQQVTILFSGSFIQSRPASSQCKYVNRYNDEIIIRN